MMDHGGLLGKKDMFFTSSLDRLWIPHFLRYGKWNVSRLDTGSKRFRRQAKTGRI
jgi:hypothetical protein